MAEMSERELKEALRAITQYNSDRRADAVKKEQLQTFETELKKVTYRFWKWLVFLTAVILIGGYNFFRATSVKDMLMHAVVILIISQNVVLMKLWYWMARTRLGFQKEMKELQLQIADLAAKDRPSEA